MAEKKVHVIDSNDKLEGTLTVVGSVTVSSTLGAAGIITGGAGLALTGTLTCAGAMTGTSVRTTGDVTAVGSVTASTGLGTAGTMTAATIDLTTASTNAVSAGLAWTTGVPVFSAGQCYMTVKVGATTYRVPLWLNA